ncbi:hypothetical protein FH972_018973 [Carpinus fangiana]|uniref:ATPase AAA-type core domain-containing protein n=1 Tax=Carpinus fangiana TaxID=176857 RepID=A0A5N6RS83_9ROSI|nr:hypothetical protein FH972_018973 [Carpinus fangiana]
MSYIKVTEKGNLERKINEIIAAYDFLNSIGNSFNVNIWYNSTYKNDTGPTANALARVPRSVNLVILTSLVYEQQQKLRIMMKMHGLGDGPYWMVSYAYFLLLSLIYMLSFVIFGSVTGLKFFKVVYMDEPSTGLDPASRNNLWNVVKRAKQDRAIILTTHSMEEAEVLCDRLGIFVDDSLQCIGNPRELIGRYGGSYVFTMTTSSDHEEDVEKMVRHLSPNANKIYLLSGTQKFELPKHDIRIADVFHAVENAKGRFTVFAWGLANTTLEDVFIKVARRAQAFNVLS